MKVVARVSNYGTDRTDPLKGCFCIEYIICVQLMNVHRRDFGYKIGSLILAKHVP